MDKLDYIHRPIKIEDYNKVVDTINTIIEAISKKPTIQIQWNEMDVKDIKDYTKLDISLPYSRSILINDLDSLKETSMEFYIPYEMTKTIIDYLGMSMAVNLNIHFEESPEVKDIIISQGEISLEDFKEDVIPKPGRKKKDGTTKSTRSATKKNSGASKGRVSKKKS